MSYIKDQDSGYSVPAGVYTSAVNRSGFLYPVMRQIPVFLVLEATMDKEAPPNRGLNRECVAKVLNSDLDAIPEGREASEARAGTRRRGELYSRLERCEGVFPEVGAYLHSSDVYNGKHVLIAPARIPQHDQLTFNDVFIHILFHEMTHAYLDSGRNHDLGDRVIEESLSEAVAVSRFEGESLERVLEFASDPGRPAEYTGYVFWLDVFRMTTPKVVTDLVKRNRIPYVYLASPQVLVTHPLFRTPVRALDPHELLHYWGHVVYEELVRYDPNLTLEEHVKQRLVLAILS